MQNGYGKLALMGLFVKDTEFFGLDIGSTALRLVQLRRGAEHPALVAYGALPVPANLNEVYCEVPSTFSEFRVVVCVAEQGLAKPW